MLLFIMALKNMILSYSNSNTSHVIVYPCRCLCSRCFCAIQIHLMLLFILSSFISEHKFWDSNTSHVIVYLYRDPDPGFVTAFKYISCYCLSKGRDNIVRTSSRFKYISCYCLSSRTRAFIRAGGYSNTSHVIVYHCRKM